MTTTSHDTSRIAHLLVLGGDAAVPEPMTFLRYRGIAVRLG